MNALSGVLAAVIARARTGKGVHLEVSLLDTVLGFMTYMAQSYWQTGVNPRPMGTAHPSMVPYQAFDVQDGAIMLGAGNDAQWQRFCAVAGLQDWVDHPEFATNALRVTNLQHEPRAVSRPAPLLGEHTQEILRQLGYDAQQIARLQQQGAVTAASQ